MLPVEPPKKKERRVFLAPEKWDDIDDAAAFHAEAYDLMDMPQALSGNELVDTFLTWALDLFWKDKGGRPSNAADRKKKVAAFAEVLKAELAKAKAEKSDNNKSR